MSQELRHENHHGGAGAFVIGLLLGAAVGAGVALLMAPKSGKQTRDDLTERAKKVRESATESYHQATEKVGHLVDKGREAYEKARGVAHRTRADIKQNVQELVGSGVGHEG